LPRGAQQAKLRTVGFLGAAGPAVASHWLAAFVQRLHELGWIEGRNVAFEVRWARTSSTETLTQLDTPSIRLADRHGSRPHHPNVVQPDFRLWCSLTFGY
jgi:hypothetical protein